MLSVLVGGVTRGKGKRAKAGEGQPQRRTARGKPHHHTPTARKNLKNPQKK